MAEWLATGQGIGAAVLEAMVGFRHLEMWSAVTAVSILAYALLGIVESVVLTRMGLD